MLSFLARRVAATIPVLFGVSLVVFATIHLVPGDPAELIAGRDATRADVENVRQRLGLGEPLPVQYARFVGRALSGDFGRSFRTNRPVADELGTDYVNTLYLGTTALVIAVVSGGFLGILAAVWQHGLIDLASLAISLIGVSVPTFLLGLLLMLLFAVDLGWLPLAGMEEWRSIILPAVTLAASSAAIIARITRASMVEVLRQDYIRTARAKGLGGYAIVMTHALRNALIPIVTVIGLQMGYLLGGAVVTEIVFAWPGVGRLIVQAIAARDFPVVQAAVLLLATSFVVVNLLTDLLYRLLDPRVAAS